MDTIIDNNLLKIFPTTPEVMQQAADYFVEQAQTAITQKNKFIVALSGGNTAPLFYQALIEKKAKIIWEKIQFYFADERYVSPGSEESNYHSAKIHLFNQVPVDPKNIFRVPTELPDPQKAAEQYAEKIPQDLFDLVILGLGENAHTASLMPNTEIVKNYAQQPETERNWVASLWVEELNMYRITLTPTAINQSKRICFMVVDAKKATAVWQILLGPHNPVRFPAQLIRNNNPIIWFLDQAAAGKIQRAS